MNALLALSTWVPILDGDPEAARLYEEHYSARKSLAMRLARGTLLFVGPGQKLVLSTPCRRALFAWRFSKFRYDRETGVECSIFRNKGAGLSSDLIRAADIIADARFGPMRHFTYVDPSEVSQNPGFCFKQAGWRFVRRSNGGLHLLERLPK